VNGCDFASRKQLFCLFKQVFVPSEALLDTVRVATYGPAAFERVAKARIAKACDGEAVEP